MEPLPLGRCTEKISSSKQCNQWANRICSHCQRQICFEHYSIHQNLIQIRTDNLHNQINDLRQCLHTLTYEQINRNLQEKIQRWGEKQREFIELKQNQMKEDLVKNLNLLNIEQFCSEQLNRIDEFIDKPLVDLSKLPKEIQMKQIENLEEQFEKIKNQIEIFGSFIEMTDQGQLKLNHSLTPIDYYPLTDCPFAMAGSTLSHRYLLIFQSKPTYSLIFLNNKQFISQFPIDYFINDITWCQSRQIFLLATDYYLFEYYPINNRLSKPYRDLQSTRIQSSLACSSTDIYILYKPDMMIYQRNLQQPFDKRNQWSKDVLMHEKTDQIIASIRIDEQKQIMALSIQQVDSHWRIDLFSISDMQRLFSGSTFHIHNQINSSFCTAIPLLNQHNQWLVQENTRDKCRTRLIHENAQLINQFDCFGSNLTLIDTDQVAFLSQIGIYFLPKTMFCLSFIFCFK